jgi:flavin-dependent dehydrogenase
VSDGDWQRELSSREAWDVVVLGAGPAGAIAARQLARAGRQVLLVEKHRLPRPKVCGGCLGGAALSVLDQVGLAHLPRQCRGVPLHTMRLANRGRVVEFRSGRRVAVSRERFDHALVEEAKNSSVTLFDQTVGELPAANESSARSVRLVRPGHTLIVEAKAVIVATGLGTTLAECTSALALNSFIGVSAIVEQSMPRAQRQSLLMACSREGYVGMAAVGDHLLDVAAAISPHALPQASSTSELIGRIISDAGLDPPAGLEAANWRGTPQLTRFVRPLVPYRAVLVGDAAGYVEPFTGEGIGWAMQSAVEAAALVHEQLESWDACAVVNWARRYETALRRRHRRCRAVTGALRSGAIRSAAMWALEKLPALASPIVHGLDRPLRPFTTSPMELQHGR